MPSDWSGKAESRNLLRIGASAVSGGDCPAYQAAKARPAMRAARRPRVRKARLDDFPLGTVMSAVDEVEFRGRPITDAAEMLGRTGRPLHPGAIRWGQHALTAYIAFTGVASLEGLVPVRHFWVARRSDSRTVYEMYAWGRRYESQDETIREVRFLRHGSVNADKTGPARDMSKAAIAAYSAAFGGRAAWPESWDEPFRLLPGEPVLVERVRVLEVGLADGSHDILFDGTPEQAEALYAEHARDRVRDISRGGLPQAGYDCADCKLVTACDALPRIPGLFGITDPTGPLRTWSATNGRQYAACPARDHLLRLKLPREDDEYSLAAVRGQAVHAWLEQTHAGQPRSACTVWDTPVRHDDWSAGRWHLTGEQALDGARMLAGHADLCPFHRGGITDVLLEPTVAVHDTAANVVLIAKPDMLYLEDGSWVWREVKTRARLPQRGADLYQEFPQLAVAVALMAEHALGGKPCGQRVELELLSPRAGDIWLIDPADQAEVRAARAALLDLAAPWHADVTAAARPGPHCADCPVRRWCPDADPAAAL
jgi:hypothetical protein